MKISKKVLNFALIFSVLGSINSFANMKLEYDESQGTYLEIDGEKHKAKYNEEEGILLIDGKEFKGPGWLWSGGNHYYFEKADFYGNTGVVMGTRKFDGVKMLKNGKTPDGKTVDSLGREIDAEGNVIHSDYGNVKLGMQNKYRGKSDNQIWEIMRNEMIKLFSNMYVENNDMRIEGTSIACRARKDGVEGNIGQNDYPDMLLIHNYIKDENKDGYIALQLPYFWNINNYNRGLPSKSFALYATSPELIERMIKITLGDNAGQELFDYIRTQLNSGEYMSKSLNFNFNDIGRIQDKYILQRVDGSAFETTESEYNHFLNTGEIRTEPQIIRELEINPNISRYDYDVVIRTSDIDMVEVLDVLALSKIDFSDFQNKPTDYGKHYSINGTLIEIY